TMTPGRSVCRGDTCKNCSRGPESRSPSTLAGCRLERALAMLTDPRHLHLAIIDIAFAVGFGDVSHFNRMFHKRFGETPSCVRGASIMREQGDPATPHSARATPLNASICGLREHPSAT